jgi:hypothetical protein
LLEAFPSVCEWLDVYFGWRPNLSDEGDNHLIELAVAGGAGWIVTNNLADFERAERGDSGSGHSFRSFSHAQSS